MSAFLIFVWLILIVVFCMGHFWRFKSAKPVDKTDKNSDLAQYVTLELSTVNSENFNFDLKFYHSMLEVLSAIYDLKKYDNVVEYNQYQFTKTCINVKLDNGNLLKLANISSYKKSLEFIPNISQKLIDEVTRMYVALAAFYTWSIDSCITDFNNGDKEVQTQQGNFILKAK
ncbi:MAG: hypothetical protein FWG64_11655 [Firmicutes bacterium]|nr:hypothetical protein [Bacillota bacterium]